MRLRLTPWLGLLISASLLGSGCGESSPRIPKTYPVQGKVTYKGQRLIRGTIVFEPEGAGKEGRAEIQPDGTYVLSTYREKDGAVPGTHRVSINGATGKAKSTLIPPHYGGLNGSKLGAEVTAEKTDYPFDLN
jgi:hypothetical protein